MARVKGRDVLLDLMDTVAQLEASSERHAEALEALAGQMGTTTAQVAGLTTLYGEVARGLRTLSVRTDVLSRRMDDVSKRMDDVSERMGAVSGGVGQLSERLEQGEQRLLGLEEDLNRQVELAVQAAATARVHHQNVGRLARVIGSLADGSRDRLDNLEARVDALEKKTG